jgi:hypothetical protein
MNREENKIIWSWKSNSNPWSLKESVEWIPFTPTLNNQIEQAYLTHQTGIIIDGNYKIDLDKLLQIIITDQNKQRPVRRYSDTEAVISCYCRERFNFVQPIQRSITDDTPYYGSVFITDWLIMFTGGKLDFMSAAQHLADEIRLIKKKNIENLQQCCARLYTKPCFLFKIVNETLRDNNRTKLKTLGPFCYLLYNYIGIRHNKYLSIRNLKSTEQFPSIIAYRGEDLPIDQIEIYKQAVGTGFSYKWTSFISASKSREVAEIYASDILYVIQIQRISSNDQYVDLASIAYITEEEEILLRPGVRLKIDKYDFNSTKERYTFFVQILLSFISNIM